MKTLRYLPTSLSNQDIAKELQIRSMPEDLHRELTRQATEQGVSLNRLLFADSEEGTYWLELPVRFLEYLSDIARINRHLVATGKQQPDPRGEMLRRPKQHLESRSPSRQDIVDTIRNLRGVE